MLVEVVLVGTDVIGFEITGAVVGAVVVEVAGCTSGSTVVGIGSVVEGGVAGGKTGVGAT